MVRTFSLKKSGPRRVPNSFTEKVRTFSKKSPNPEAGIRSLRGRSGLSPQGLDPQKPKLQIFRFFQKFPIHAKTLQKPFRTFWKPTKTFEGYLISFHTLELCNLQMFSVLHYLHKSAPRHPFDEPMQTPRS